MNIIKITDNQGKTFDRYSVYVKDYSLQGDLQCWVLELSFNCDSPQGVSMVNEYPPELWKEDEDSPGEIILTVDKNEKDIYWNDLPVNIRLHIAERLLFE